MKAWHCGHALNRGRSWQTLSAGQDHPDAYRFIIINSDDYLAVDDGCAKEKRTRNHGTLLVDGRGHYAEGTKHAFRGLDETWGARLEASLESDDVISADVPHRYQWLLQTDGPPEADGHGCFTIKSGNTVGRLHAQQPEAFSHHVLKQETMANPTSA